MINNWSMCWHQTFCWHFFSLLKVQHMAWWTLVFSIELTIVKNAETQKLNKYEWGAFSKFEVFLYTKLIFFCLENQKLMDPELARSYMFQITCVSISDFDWKFWYFKIEYFLIVNFRRYVSAIRDACFTVIWNLRIC